MQLVATLRRSFFLTLLTIIRLIGIAQDKPELVLQEPFHATYFTFSPDDELLLSINGPELSLWRAPLGILLKKLDVAGEPYRSASFSPDGRKVAALSNHGYLKVWEIPSGRLLLVYNALALVQAEFIKGTDLMALRSENSWDINIYDLQQGKITQVLQDHRAAITSMKVSADGKFLVTGGGDRKAIIWKIGRPLPYRTFQLPLHKYDPLYFQLRCSFSADDRFLSVADQTLLKVFEIGSEKEVFQLEYQPKTNEFGAAFIGSDGMLLVYHSEGMFLWDIFDKALLHTVHVNHGEVAQGDVAFWISEKNNRLYGYFTKYRFLVDLLKKRNLISEGIDVFQKGNSGFAFAYSHDGKYSLEKMVAGTVDFKPNGSIALTPHPPYYKLANPSTNAEVVRIGEYKNALRSTSILKLMDKNHLLLEFKDSLVVYSLAEQKIADVWKGKLVKLAQDREKVLVRRDSLLSVYSWKGERTQRMKEIVLPPSLMRVIGGANFTEDLAFCFTVNDSVGRLWNTNTGGVIATYQHSYRQGGEVRKVKIDFLAFSPDGAKLAIWDEHLGGPRQDGGYSSGDTICILSTQTGRILYKQEVNSYLYKSKFRFSSTGRYLATEGYGTLSLQDARRRTVVEKGTAFSTVWDLNNGEDLTARLSLCGNGIDFFEGLEGKDYFLYKECTNSRFVLWEMKKGNTQTLYVPRDTRIGGENISSLTLRRADKNELYYTNNGGITRSVNILTGLVTGEMPFGGELIDVDPSYRWALMREGGLYYIGDMVSRKKRLFFRLGDDLRNFFLAAPDGYFYASTKDLTADLRYRYKQSFLEFSQLDLINNRPDKLLKYVGSTNQPLIRLFENISQLRAERYGLDTAEKNITALPETSISNQKALQFPRTADTVTLHITASDPYHPLQIFHVWINEVPLFGASGIRLGRQKLTLDTTLQIILSPGLNKIETSVINSEGIESYRRPFFLNYSSPRPIQRKTYFVGIGVENFEDATRNLHYAVSDVRGILQLLATRATDSVIVDTLFNEKFNRQNIEPIKARLRKAGTADRVIILYSGHGVLHRHQLFLPVSDMNDKDFDNPEKKAIPYTYLENLLDSIPSRNKLMLLDACHSGIFDPNAETIAGITTTEMLERLFPSPDRGTGATIIASSLGNEESKESTALQHGFLSGTIMECIRNTKSLDINTLKAYIFKELPLLTQRYGAGEWQLPALRSENRAANFSLW